MCEKGCSGIKGISSTNLFYMENDLRSYFVLFDDLIYISSKKYFPYFEIGKLILTEDNSIKMFDPIIDVDCFLDFNTISELEIKVKKMLKLKAFL